MHDSLDGRLKFAFKLVNFSRESCINLAEVTLLIDSALRGVARMKGLAYAPAWEAENMARKIFLKAKVHFRAGEGVGDYAKGGIYPKHLVDWAKDDTRARAMLDNIDFGAYLGGLLEKQQVLFYELIDIEAAKQLKAENENNEKERKRRRDGATRSCWAHLQVRFQRWIWVKVMTTLRLRSLMLRRTMLLPRRSVHIFSTCPSRITFWRPCPLSLLAKGEGVAGAAEGGEGDSSHEHSRGESESESDSDDGSAYTSTFTDESEERRKAVITQAEKRRHQAELARARLLADMVYKIYGAYDEQDIAPRDVGKRLSASGRALRQLRVSTSITKALVM